MNLLYHYCSTETLVSILSRRTIRLSSLTQSNDSKEGAAILDVFLQLARESDLASSAQARLEKELRLAYDLFDGLGFCLSEDGDLLSQWRGYADDGRGVSIGFNKDYLESLGASIRARGGRNFSLHQIVYEEEFQRAIASQHFDEIRELLHQGAFSPPVSGLLVPRSDEDLEKIKAATGKGIIAVLKSMLRMFDIKNPAFREEREWRLVSFTGKEADQSGLSFRACSDKIIPYIEFDLEGLDCQPLAEIVLGPKHRSPKHVIAALAESFGFKGVEVLSSKATYR